MNSHLLDDGDFHLHVAVAGAAVVVADDREAASAVERDSDIGGFVGGIRYRFRAGRPSRW